MRSRGSNKGHLRVIESKARANERLSKAADASDKIDIVIQNQKEIIKLIKRLMPRGLKIK